MNIDLNLTRRLRRLAGAPVAGVAGTLNSLGDDRRGTVAMTFALSSIAIVGIIGTSIEYSRSMALKADIQDAIDGAVLAGAIANAGVVSAATATVTTGSGENAATTTLTGRAAVAYNYFKAVVGKHSSQVGAANFTFNSANNTLSGTATATQPLTLGGRFGAAVNVNVAATSVIPRVTVRALDVVMCIDATGSMSNTLSAVQTNALNFQTNLTSALATYNIPAFDQVRTRVIYFRDFGGNGIFNDFNYSYYGYAYGGWTGAALGDSVPLNPSSFFTLPTDVSSFSSFVTGQSATGGGDTPESGLECLNAAMKSSWTQVGATAPNGKTIETVYPVISIYTDAGAHPPSFKWSLQNPSYPASSVMPRDYAGLLTNWNDSTIINQANKMILFYGNPSLQDDGWYNNTSGWSTVMTWPKFQNPGSLTSANTNFVSSLAAGIANGVNTPQLTN